MSKGRVEAFSDGVIAIIITIMVLEMKAPHSADLGSLSRLLPVFVSYLLSFVFVGIYWNNHHHLFHAIKHVNGTVLWANLHLLFWLSLIPFSTGWMGENHFAANTVALYGVILLFSGLAYGILTWALVSYNGKDSTLAHAVGRDYKSKISVVAYLTAIVVAYANPWVSYSMYIGVAVLWFLPDRRIERIVKD